MLFRAMVLLDREIKDENDLLIFYIPKSGRKVGLGVEVDRSSISIRLRVRNFSQSRDGVDNISSTTTLWTQLNKNDESSSHHVSRTTQPLIDDASVKTMLRQQVEALDILNWRNETETVTFPY